MFNKTIQNLVFNSIKRHPQNTAIEMDDVKLSYTDINKISNLIANDLLNFYKRPFRVALIFENKINYIVSILAVLKIRGIFAPIDIFYPKERINTILNEFTFDVILNDLDLSNPKYNNIKIPSDVSNLPCDYSRYYLQDDVLLDFGNYATDDPIYLYFTSGTTAMPKAILGKNVSLAHFIDWEISFLKAQDTIRIGQLTSPAFDPYLRDIFVPLCTGGTICIPKNRNYLINIGSLITWLDKSQITLLHCTPTLFNAIVSSSSLHKRIVGSLKYILLAGEKVNIKYLSEWFEIYQNKVVFVNLYGPSETIGMRLDPNKLLPDPDITNNWMIKSYNVTYDTERFAGKFQGANDINVQIASSLANIFNNQPGSISLAEAKTAMQEWNGINRNLRLSSIVTLDTDVGSGYDIFLKSSYFSDNTLGYTIPYRTVNGVEEEIETLRDIMLDPAQYTRAEIEISAFLYYEDAEYQKSVLTHEIGHALGLKHPFCNDVTVMKANVNDSLARSTPQPHDIYNINKIY